MRAPVMAVRSLPTSFTRRTGCMVAFLDWRMISHATLGAAAIPAVADEAQTLVTVATAARAHSARIRRARSRYCCALSAARDEHSVTGGSLQYGAQAPIPRSHGDCDLYARLGHDLVRH